jgi:hypothetical protein
MAHRITATVIRYGGDLQEPVEEMSEFEHRSDKGGMRLRRGSRQIEAEI